jgi:CpeT protein
VRKFLLLLIAVACITVSSQSQDYLRVKQKDLKKLAATMAGSFDSKAQSSADSNYYHISLMMRPIWTERTDGYWLYVEQAMATALDKPYRQRVYHLYMQDDMTIVSKVYEVQDVKQFIGGCQDPKKLATLQQSMLIDRQGCSIYLHKIKKNVYKGSTPGKECLSTLRGATYATSEVTITKGRIDSWDRGWSKEDTYLWGAEFGPYQFIKNGKF